MVKIEWEGVVLAIFAGIVTLALMATSYDSVFGLFVSVFCVWGIMFWVVKGDGD